MSGGTFPESVEVVRSRVVEALLASRRPLITGHVGMDGDSLGSAVALWHALRSTGGEPLIATNEPIPRIFEFLVPEGSVRVVRSSAHASDLLESGDLFVVLDNNAWSRLGFFESPARTSAVRVLCLDHHPAEEPFCADHLLDLAAASTGLVVYDLLEPLGAPLTREIAEAIYTSVVNDTGWFRHRNTDQRALSTCAALVAAGADPTRIDHEINHRETLMRSRLRARFLKTLRLESEGRLGFGHVTQEMLAAEGAAAEDTEDFIEHVRSLEGVALAVLLREEPDHTVKLSLRSRPGRSALRVARAFGGGGHEMAAGAVHPGPLQAALEELLHAMEAEVERPEGGLASA